MVMTLDERIGRDVEARLAAIDGILSVKQVTL
jgi:hypothetical protein